MPRWQGFEAKDCIDVQVTVVALGEAWAVSRMGLIGFRCRPEPWKNARFAMLFRDYLRADEIARQAWGAFKRRLAARVRDLADYGQIRAPATEVLIRAAELWAAQTGWTAG